MPETYWTVRWPNGQEERLYSPSSVVAEIFEPGTSYPMEDFLGRARIALTRASERVERKYGYMCTSAMAQLSRIEEHAENFKDQSGNVTCLSITQ
ncbi:MAG: MSMEG_0570 family nitrogen starvation response protein [Pseudomonadota bacterium]